MPITEPEHSSPGGQLPRQIGKSPPHGSSVDEVVVLVLVVVVVGARDVEVDVVVGVAVVDVEVVGTEVVEVVVVEGQVPQQVPLSAAPPRCSQPAAELEMRQRGDSTDPSQQATRSVAPQPERAAQRTTARRHSPGSSPAATSARAV
jgi:hypothetical protein